MKSCLGIFLLAVVIAALALTLVYHTSLNSTLRFEPRDTNAQYINTRRSYRPPAPPKTPRAASPAVGIPYTAQDDEAAEEVEP